MSTPLVSTGTAATIAVGAVVSFLYVRYMWAALRKSVRTRFDPDVGTDRFALSLGGAAISAVASAGAIAAYGLGPALLYLGPILALASPLAVAFCLRDEAIND
jgi:small-conductance mechanosensitive channel